jgi:hypothetical protein
MALTMKGCWLAMQTKISAGPMVVLMKTIINARVQETHPNVVSRQILQGMYRLFLMFTEMA